jgi:hypothetical protein
MQFMRQLTTFISTKSRHHQAPAHQGSLSSTIPVSLTPPGAQNPLSYLDTVTVPPKVVPLLQQPAPTPPAATTGESFHGTQQAVEKPIKLPAGHSERREESRFITCLSSFAPLRMTEKPAFSPTTSTLDLPLTALRIRPVPDRCVAGLA